MAVKFNLPEAQNQAKNTKPNRRPWSPPLRYATDDLGISHVFRESRADRRRLEAEERQTWRRETRKNLKAGQISRADLLSAVPRPVSVKGK